uniref:Uncharacterized protein n=1 Tax=Arundo donax TaxID=35708 RepID=A0A0A8YVF2_ARUDO
MLLVEYILQRLASFNPFSVSHTTQRKY